MSQYLRQEFLSIALSSLTKNLTLSVSQYNDFQNVLIKMIDNIDLSNVDAEEAKSRFKIVMDRAANKGNVYIGIYIAYILTHDAMQGGLDTFHKLGSTEISKSNLQLQLSDITQFKKTKLANTIVAIKFNKYININQINMVAETFVGIYLANVVSQIDINPKVNISHTFYLWRNKKWSLSKSEIVSKTISNHLSLVFILDQKKMENLNICLDTIIEKLSKCPFTNDGLNSVYICKEKRFIYLVSGSDISHPEESRKKMDEMKNIQDRLLLRGHPNIQDLFINYNERLSLLNYETYTDVPFDEISYAFIVNNKKAIKYITTHPMVDEVITVRHGGLYNDTYGIVQTSNFIIRNKNLFKYQDLFVSILAQLLTLSGKLNSVIDSIKFNEDILTSSFKGRSMETLVEYASKGNEVRRLGNVAYFSIFGNLPNERAPSQEYIDINNKLFKNIPKRKIETDTAIKLFADYEYEL